MKTYTFAEIWCLRAVFSQAAICHSFWFRKHLLGVAEHVQNPRPWQITEAGLNSPEPLYWGTSSDRRCWGQQSITTLCLHLPPLAYTDLRAGWQRCNKKEINISLKIVADFPNPMSSEPPWRCSEPLEHGLKQAHFIIQRSPSCLILYKQADLSEPLMTK